MFYWHFWPRKCGSSEHSAITWSKSVSRSLGEQNMKHSQLPSGEELSVALAGRVHRAALGTGNPH